MNSLVILRGQAWDQVRSSRVREARELSAAGVVPFPGSLGDGEFARTWGEIRIPDREGWKARPGCSHGGWRLGGDFGQLRAEALNLKSLEGP